MKKKITSLLLLPLLLSSCGSFKGSVKAYKNGEIYFENEITYENALVHANFNMIYEMINSNEPFLLYFKSEGCLACNEFKGVLTEYVNNTKQTIYYMDTNDDYEEFKKLDQKYKEVFFPSNEGVYTPQLYAYSESCIPVKNTKYENITMFTNAMKETVSECEVYKVNTYVTLEKFINAKEEIDIFTYDRSESSFVTKYNQIKNDIEKTNRKSIILEIDRMSEKDILITQALLGIMEFRPEVYTFSDAKKK